MFLPLMPLLIFLAKHVRLNVLEPNAMFGAARSVDEVWVSRNVRYYAAGQSCPVAFVLDFGGDLRRTKSSPDRTPSQLARPNRDMKAQTTSFAILENCEHVFVAIVNDLAIGNVSYDGR